MAVYLRLPPGSEGRQCQPGSQSSPPTRACANGASGEAEEAAAAAAASGLGYLNLPMARSQASGHSGKCSPQRCSGPGASGVGSPLSPAFSSFLLSRPHHGPQAAWTWSLGLGLAARAEGLSGHQMERMRSLKASFRVCWDQARPLPSGIAFH